MARWIITLDGRLPAAQVAAALRSAGLVVIDVMEQVGVIIGEADEGAVPQLRQVPGVADVAPDLAMGIVRPPQRP
ncbi:hypothetical protein [Massilia sp. TS11]|uniref:hypothetical protein n=1 Tax=Massilia sp. TS11 TaxID=2908003 RepID=UPI001EDA645D|nr:hypothetical protein [Massilia sp. TS11]MCG2584271.1 hypothetical protein [Massilia sp. TS11]